jgi:hypothetical protein
MVEFWIGTRGAIHEGAVDFDRPLLSQMAALPRKGDEVADGDPVHEGTATDADEVQPTHVEPAKFTALIVGGPQDGTVFECDDLRRQTGKELGLPSQPRTVFRLDWFRLADGRAHVIAHPENEPPPSEDDVLRAAEGAEGVRWRYA